MVKNRIDMRVRGRGIKYHPGKEVGCSDRPRGQAVDVGRALYCLIANGKKLYL